MNTWQVLRQFKYLLKAQKWPSGTKPAFGSVHVTVAPDERAMERFRFPLALVRPLGSIVDPIYNEEGDILRQDIQVTLIVSVASDAIGEAALIGGNRSGGVTESSGRGLLEVEEVLFDAITRVNGIDGVEMVAKQKSAVEAQIRGDVQYVAWRGYNIEAFTTVDRFYHPATRLAGTGLGGGSVSLTWKLPPSRYDLYRMTLRRAAGGTPPATPASGTGVTLSGDLVSSVTDTPGAGTFSYALFAQYDESYDQDTGSPSSAERDSAAETLTIGVS